MSKIVLVLCVTVLVASLALAYPQEYDEVLAQEIQELLDYQRNSIAQMFINNFSGLKDDSDDEGNKKCRRPLQRCCEDKSCCSKLRCSKLLGRCLPKLCPSKPTTEDPNM